VKRYHLLGRTDWEEIHLPKSATLVDRDTFDDCHHLKKLIFGNPDIEFKSLPFSYCKCPEELSFKTAKYTFEDCTLYNADKTVLIYCWKRADYPIDLVIPEGVKEIGSDYAEKP